ncbi:serine hydrolase [Rhodobacter capsulatus]|uniref:serine hydrolase domain-containing protein n=1 Tax=Rhodobacter capsulatus TaxID=1061 RepID=UPI0006DC31EE|nr:serine hydrolase [Rhodobacter capsulatus]KQB16520.1 6-aminohexanoate hydrolase [Rhodobacter capsulatus]KQB17030.1 6-aminohexanoate hydrolase [Rhodobacter capsulatus]PZX21869.1 CubicO group peptidase (beta-lactamase class C family) [Rhodobacter capsulatus]QNR62493.1 serine hydrolase [Rhodobacter capsulatus]
MRRFLRIFWRVLLVLLVLGAGAALVKRDDIARLMAVQMLFDEGRIVENFSQMDRLFHARVLDRGPGPVSALPMGVPETLSPEAEAWISRRAVTALVILRDGRITYENYYKGTGPEDLRISWSMAKSVLSALFGTLVAEGAIPDLDAQVVDFVPQLKGSAYDGVSIRDVLTMTSGVHFDEDYMKFSSDINRMGRVLALGGSMDGFAASLKTRATEPGSHMHYVSVDTHVLGMVIKGATGRDPVDLMAERIIQPMALEASPVMLTDGEGTGFVLGGLNLRTRDYARIGQMFLQGGFWNGRQIVPADWVAASTAHQAADGAGYGYQWWVPRDNADFGNDYMAQGIYGQFIYINPARNVVIAVNAADLGFAADGVTDENLAMFRQLAQAGP